MIEQYQSWDIPPSLHGEEHTPARSQLMIVRTLSPPHNHPHRAVLPIHDPSPRQHRERRAVRTDEAEPVGLNRGVDDDGVPVSQDVSTCLIFVCVVG